MTTLYLSLHSRPEKLPKMKWYATPTYGHETLQR